METFDENLIQEIANTLSIDSSDLCNAIHFRAESSGSFSAAFITAEIHEDLPPNSIKPVDAGIILFFLLSKETEDEEKKGLKSCLERLPESLKGSCKKFISQWNARHTSPRLAKASDATFAATPA